jgi:hypothetical protein
LLKEKKMTLNIKFLRKTLPLFCLVLLISCKEEPNTINQNSKYGRGVRSLASKTTSGLDTIAVDCALKFTISDKSISADSNALYSQATAVFTDDSFPVNVSYVKINNQNLVPTTITGQYELFSGGTSYSSTASWDISGYAGGTLTNNAPVPALIALSSHSAADSVSKLSGFTLNYSGYDGGDLDMYIRFDNSLTSAFVDSALGANGGGLLTKSETDDGSVTISSGDLSGFTSGGYIEVMLHHWEYHVVLTSAGRPVGVYSEVTKTVPLFLKP